MSLTPNLGDRVTVTDGSSDGHTGEVVLVYPHEGAARQCVRIRRDADGVFVDVRDFYIHHEVLSCD